MELKKTLTVFTPTYNRAYCLPLGYEALKRQTCIDFKWLIIDDGSTDNTRELVHSWINEGIVDIQYQYKENGGMHTAHNAAYELIDTELNVCIDSDDYMTDDAVEIILNEFSSCSPEYAGIVGLDADTKGNIIGTIIPKDLKACKLNELYLIHNVKGDKKIIYRTEIIKRYADYPVFKGEKFVPLDYKYLLIDQDYFLKPINKIFCIVDYRSDGSTKNIFRQYRRNPNGFAFSRISRINYAITYKELIKNAVHLVSSAFFAKDFTWLFKSRKTFIVLALLPLGILLNFYVRIKTYNAL